MTTPKKRNSQDATRSQVKKADDAIRHDVSDVEAKIKALDRRLQTVEQCLDASMPVVFARVKQSAGS